MNPRVLNAGRIPAELRARLQSAFELVDLPAEGRASFLAEQGREIAGAVATAATGLAPEVVEALPKLRVVSLFGVGLDRIDRYQLARRGIALGFTRGLADGCVADHAFALLLDVARRVSAADRFVRAGRWAARTYPLATRVGGGRLGVVGLGGIGQAIARRAAGFDMQVRYHTRRPVAGVPWPHEPVLDELARWADFLVLAASGGPGTRHLVDAGILASLGPQGFLVNIARGSVVDQQALAEALRQGRIAGAGLDVFEHEPEVPADLLALDNVVLTPHIASGTVQTREAMSALAAANLETFFATGRVACAAPLGSGS